MEKFGTTKHATDDNVTLRMRFAYRITKATDVHSEYVIFVAITRPTMVARTRPIVSYTFTGYTQKNGTVSKVNKKFIIHLTRAQRTPLAAATVEVSHALLAGRFSRLLWGRGASFQDGVAKGKGFLCAPF